MANIKFMETVSCHSNRRSYPIQTKTRFMQRLMSCTHVEYQHHLSYNMSRICKNKGADDQRLCFRYIARAIPLHPKYKILSLWPPSVTVQHGLCQTWSARISRDEAHILSKNYPLYRTCNHSFSSIWTKFKRNVEDCSINSSVKGAPARQEKMPRRG